MYVMYIYQNQDRVRELRILFYVWGKNQQNFSKIKVLEIKISFVWLWTKI